MVLPHDVRLAAENALKSLKADALKVAAKGGPEALRAAEAAQAAQAGLSVRCLYLDPRIALRTLRVLRKLDLRLGIRTLILGAPCASCAPCGGCGGCACRRSCAGCAGVVFDFELAPRSLKHPERRVAREH